jgi:hypothetical protein
MTFSQLRHDLVQSFKELVQITFKNLILISKKAHRLHYEDRSVNTLFILKIVLDT